MYHEFSAYAMVLQTLSDVLIPHILVLACIPGIQEHHSW